MSDPAASPFPHLSAPLTLPCGATLPNRLAKAAMTERLADARNRATPALERLYRLWAEGGAGLLLTGNVQVDRRHLEAAGNVAIDGTEDAAARTALERFAAAGKSGGGAIWMQISHAGRQTPKRINATPKAPSAVTVALPGGQFGQPVALTDDDILALIARFAHAARVAKDSGFDGVQIHGAHGYLISSFLSPRANLRTDAWGGDIAGRSRFLLETFRAVRQAVGDAFPVGVKLNSADFQRGGFSFTDSQDVARALDAEGCDLLEISGGNYEQPRMVKIDGMEAAEEPVAASTREREAYFLRFAPEMRAALTRTRLMITGGFRTASGMEEAVRDDGVDVIGLGRPLCVMPDAPRDLLAGRCTTLPRHETSLRVGPGWLGPRSPIAALRTVNGFAAQSWFYEQLISLSDTGRADLRRNPFVALVNDQRREARRTKALEGLGG